MSKGRLMILGAGGHARVVVTLAALDGGWEIAGAADRVPDFLGEAVGPTTVTATFADLPQWPGWGITHVALALGDNRERRGLADAAEAARLGLATLIHPTAHLDPGAMAGPGAVICAGAILGAEARLGRGAILNTGAVADHETTIGDFAQVASGCVLAGRVDVGDDAMIGLGARICPGVSIGDAAIIGAGAVVLRDVAPRTRVLGIPAKPDNET